MKKMKKRHYDYIEQIFSSRTMGKRGAKGVTCRSQHPSGNNTWCEGCKKKTGCTVTSTEHARKNQLELLGQNSRDKIYI